MMSILRGCVSLYQLCAWLLDSLASHVIPGSHSQQEMGLAKQGSSCLFETAANVLIKVHRHLYLTEQVDFISHFPTEYQDTIRYI